MKTQIKLTLAILISPFLAINLTAQETPAQAPLTSDPANDQFARINNFYKAAVTTTDRRTSEAYYGRCIPLISEYLRKFPTHRNVEAASYYLGESYYKIGELNKSITTFEKLIKRYKTGSYVAASAYRIARNLYSASKFEEASTYFEITAQNAQDKADRTRSTYFQAQCLTRAGKFKEAMPLYGVVSNISTLNPYQRPATLTHAKLLLQFEQFKEALETCEKLLVPTQDEDTKAESSYYAGVAASNLRDQEKALDYFRMSLNSNSKKLKGRAQTGIMGIYYAKKDYDSVLEEVRKGKYEMQPIYRAKQGLIVGNSFYIKKNYTNAIGYFVDVESNDKGSDVAFEAGYKKLLCFYNIKDNLLAEKVDRFLETYAVGRGKHKFIHQAFLMKAETLFAKEEFKGAAKAFGVINTDLIDEKYHESLMYKRGCSLAKVENNAGATNAFTEFIDRFPESESILNAYLLRAGAYRKLDDKSRALRDYDHVIAVAPKTKNAAIALQQSGQLQWVSKKTEDATARFKTLLKDYPELPVKVRAYAYYMLGRGEFKAKEFKAGLKHLEKSLELDPVTFSKQIAMYRVIGYFTLREVKGTADALNLASKVDIEKKIPLNVYRWLGGEYYNNEEYKKSAEFLRKGVERGEPDATPLTIWRILSKAQLKAELYQDAFISISFLLDLEDDKAKIVDALLDKAKIQVALGKTGDSKTTAEEALAMNPTGKTQVELLKILGDFHYMIGEPREAANRYVLLVDSAENLEFHPLVIDRLARSLDKLGDKDESLRYEAMLKKRYPRYTREKL